MAGTIGVPCTDLGRYSAFTDSLSNLERPEGTQVKMAVCNWRHNGRNELVRWLLASEGEWLLMVDDDHVFAPDLLLRLLSHKRDIVAALSLRREEPYGPFCFSEKKNGSYRVLTLRSQPPGLIPVRAVGTGAMLIRRGVFEMLADPWFTVTNDSGEDMRFCDTATDYGFEIFCDLGAPIGHLTTAVVWPVETPQGWRAGIEVSGETRFLRELPGLEMLDA